MSECVPSLQCQTSRASAGLTTRKPQIRDEPGPRIVRDAPPGGARRDRTDDLMLAKHALSQLSYGPCLVMVGLGRLERPTSPLSGVRSNHLSYRPSPAPRRTQGRRPAPRRALRLILEEERETRTATSRKWSLTGTCCSKCSNRDEPRRSIRLKEHP